MSLQLTDKNILLISPEPWDHIFVSKHHYATHLAKKGNTVFFLNPPSDQTVIEKTEFENVYSVHYDGFIIGLRFFPSFLQKYFIRQKFQQLQKRCNVKFDIIWSFDNSVFFDFTGLPNHLIKISHIVDWNQNFEFKVASSTADLCLSSSNYILAKQKKINESSYNIGHGFNNIHDEFKSFSLKGENKYNCGYAGNLDLNYIDWDLVECLLKEFPNVDFHFVGQWSSNKKYRYIYEKSNFHYYGKLQSNLLQSFYKSMDVLILVYLYEKYPKQLANPHKMMEYLASGKMIIASWTDEYYELDEKHLIKMAKEETEFLKHFKIVISTLDHYNSIEKKERRIGFASSSSYAKKIDEIQVIINSENR